MSDDITKNTPEDLKGRAKEAAGALTDDQDLKNEGKVDQASASVKDAVDGVRDKVEEGVDKAKDLLSRDDK